MKEGGGNDHLAIAWEYPDQPLEVIPAKFSRNDSPCAMNPYCGAILDTWTNISGVGIGDLRGNTDELTSVPNQSTRLSNLLESPSNIDDNYGRIMKGWLLPPVTGNYSFWIASDDNGEFWLSTDSDPANLVLICFQPSATERRQWYKYPDQSSKPITLVAGETIYYEVRWSVIFTTLHVEPCYS